LFHRRGEIIIYRKQDSNMKKSSLILLYIFCLLPLAAQRPPKHEVRAAWVTAVYGLDWPRTRATTPESIRKQQDELVEILDSRQLQHRTVSDPYAGRCALQIVHRAL